MDVVVVGTVLEATAEQSGKSANLPSFGGISLGGNKQTVKATVTLQADLYSTSTGQKIDSIRQTESASESKIGTDVNTGLGGLNTGGASFDNSAMGKAFHAVVASIVKKINERAGADGALLTRCGGEPVGCGGLIRGCACGLCGACFGFGVGERAACGRQRRGGGRTAGTESDQDRVCVWRKNGFL